jgi:MCM N-terminal domain
MKIIHLFYFLNCRDLLDKDTGHKRLRVDLQDIKRYNPDLGNCLENQPAEYLPLVCASIPCRGFGMSPACRPALIYAQHKLRSTSL